MHLGFTLMEVIVVVVIIGILAAIGLPSYRKAVERGYRRTSEDLLQTIYHGERAYAFTNNGAYKVGLGPASPNSDWRTIHMDNPNSPGSMPVSFSVAPDVSGTGFIAKADRQDGRSMTIDHNRTLDASAWPMP